MEPVFRLHLQRPAVAQSDETPSIPLAQNSNLQAAMAQAMQAKDVRAALKTAASQFVSSPAYRGDPRSLALDPQFQQLDSALDALEKKANPTPAELSDAIKKALGDTPANLVKKKTLDGLAADLRDTILAIKQLPEEHKRPIEDVTNILRDIEVVLKAAADPTFAATGTQLRRYRRRSVLLPTTADLRSILSTRDKDKQQQTDVATDDQDRRKQLNDALALYRRLQTAVDELTALGGEHINTTVQRPSAAFLPPAELRPLATLARDVSQQQTLFQAGLTRAQALSIRLASSSSAVGDSTSPGGQLSSEPVGAVAAIQRRSFAGIPAFQPLAVTAVGFRLRDTAVAALSQSTLQLLKERNLSLTALPLDAIVARLRTEMTGLANQAQILMGQAEQFSFKRIGSAVVKIRTVLPSEWTQLISGSPVPYIPTFVADTRIPQTHGKVSAAGVADLLVIRQQLEGYDAMDIAHIENVLQGEGKLREHRRLDQTETTTVDETESTKETEHDLESTDRYEMKRESEQTIKEDASLKAGLTVSGSYGPSVQFSASAEGSLSRSKEEATKAATTFSKDVTEKTVSKLTERVLRRTTVRVLSQVEEKNTHTLNNVGGAGNIAGIYQWVEKVYEAQMFNYGLRQMYDFMIPEPAAYLITAMSTAHANMVEVEKPAEFTLKPNQISESNYHYWVHLYGATDVVPPPEIYRTKTADYSAGGGDEHTDYYRSGQITIDEGYQAIFGSVGINWNQWDSNAALDVVLGSRAHRFNDSTDWVWSTTLDQERDAIPYGLTSLQMSQLAVAIEVKCQRTDRAMTKWQLETHGKIVNAYNAKLADYEERLTNLQMQAGVAIMGKNPGLNLELMKDELKKHCITIITDQHFDLFGAIDPGPYNTQQINLYQNEAEGPYVRFFEQAFEWEEMTWLTYPYFWGRKSKWAERVAYEDVDALFNQFLKAGSCRVVVPVRPGFEGAVDHFLTYGEIWDGGPLPAISNPLYLPIADEIAERLDRPGDEIEQGDPWEVRVPTTLVYLKGDFKLPAWKKDAQGKWVPA